MGNITAPTGIQTHDAAGDEGHSTFAQVINALADGSIPAVKVAGGGGGANTDLDQQSGNAPPTLRGDGTSALVIGDQWYQPTEGATYVWDGTQWVPLSNVMQATAAGSDSIGNAIAVGDNLITLADGSVINLDALGGSGGGGTYDGNSATVGIQSIQAGGNNAANINHGSSTSDRTVTVTMAFDQNAQGELTLPTGIVSQTATQYLNGAGTIVDKPGTGGAGQTVIVRWVQPAGTDISMSYQGTYNGSQGDDFMRSTIEWWPA